MDWSGYPRGAVRQTKCCSKCRSQKSSNLVWPDSCFNFFIVCCQYLSQLPSRIQSSLQFTPACHVSLLPSFCLQWCLQGSGSWAGLLMTAILPTSCLLSPLCSVSLSPAAHTQHKMVNNQFYTISYKWMLVLIRCITQCLKTIPAHWLIWTVQLICYQPVRPHHHCWTLDWQQHTFSCCKLKCAKVAQVGVMKTLHYRYSFGKIKNKKTLPCWPLIYFYLTLASTNGHGSG